VVGDLPGHPEREREDRRPLGEPARPGADRVLGGQPGAQRVRGVGLDAGRVMAVSRCSEGQMPGSGETRPNPVFCAIPTQPDHTSAAAGAARTSSGQDRRARAPAGDRSAAAGRAVRAGTGPRRPGSGTRDASMATAAIPFTALPSWRAGEARRSARRPLR